jgi:hypothetical protein
MSPEAAMRSFDCHPPNRKDVWGELKISEHKKTTHTADCQHFPLDAGGNFQYQQLSGNLPAELYGPQLRSAGSVWVYVHW